MGDSLGNFLPSQLPLHAKLFRHILYDQDRAWPAMTQFQPCACYGQMQSAPVRVKLNLGRCCAHPLAATNHTEEVVNTFGCEQGFELLAAQDCILLSTKQ